MAICLDEPRKAGFIALQMSKMWGMFEGGEERTLNAGLEGRPGCPYHNDFKRYPNITENDQEGILLPSTAMKISQSEIYIIREGWPEPWQIWLRGQCERHHCGHRPEQMRHTLLDWCLRKGRWLLEDHNKKCVRAREAQKNLDEEFRRRTYRLSIGDRYA